MNVLLVTSWDIPCGIAESSAMLKEYVERADPDLNLYVHSAEGKVPPPEKIWADWGTGWPIIHLNYHAALHSQWTPEWVARFQAEKGAKVVITYHDTMSGETAQRNSPQCVSLWEQADAFIVHEPVADLPGAIYWRQGVLPPAVTPIDVPEIYHDGSRPLVGSVGFPYPWKNYDLLCSAAYDAGWDVLLIAPSATGEQIAEWKRRHPRVIVEPDFMTRAGVLSFLSVCDATAFLYLNANTGTSGAIRMGMAARKPLLATDWRACRQFRDLAFDPGINWLPDLSPAKVTEALAWVTPHYRMHRTAHRDSWAQLGQKYAKLYRSLLA